MPVYRLFKTWSRTLSIAMGRLSDQIAEWVHADTEALRDEHGRIILLDHHRSVAERARAEPAPLEHARRVKRSIEKDAPLAWSACRRSGRRFGAEPRHGRLAGHADRGRAQRQDLEIGRIVGIAVDAAVRVVKRPSQGLAPPVVEERRADGHRELERLSEIA